MKLTPEAARTLVEMLAQTHDHELECDDCVQRMAAFAETELAGRTLCEALTRVQEHLTACPECREEYELLRDALTALGQGDCGPPPAASD